jgi:hypothetical protein
MAAGFAHLSAVCITGLLIVFRQLRLVRSRFDQLVRQYNETREPSPPARFESSAGGSACAPDIDDIDCAGPEPWPG